MAATDIDRIVPASERHAPRSWTRGPRFLSSVPLFWRVFLVNGALMTVGVGLLAFTPLTISNPITPRQLFMLLSSAVILLAANFLLLRRSLRPLKTLTSLMERTDVLRPGERLRVGGARELNVVLAAFNRMLDRIEQERRTSSTRIVSRVEGERQRVASDLHDEVGQGLTVLLLQLKRILAVAPPELRAPLLEAQEVARTNLDEIRRIARQLRPSALDDLGLAYALLALADTVEEGTDLHVVRSVNTSVPRLGEPAELALYRIAQAAITNVVRHADAARVEIGLDVTPAADAVELVVRDDGRGMLHAAEAESGGLRGMRERALAVDARLAVESRPGGGTTIRIRLPVTT